MSLKVFENKLKEQCKITFCDLKDGSRLNRLLKNKKNSLLDVMYSGRKRPNPLLQSCAISFGHVLEKATMNYAQEMKAKGYKNKKLQQNMILFLE